MVSATSSGMTTIDHELISETTKRFFMKADVLLSISCHVLRMHIH
jgi:hypothetical protein